MRLAALYFREVRKMSQATVAPQTDLPHSIKPVHFFTQPRRLLSVLGQCSFSKKKTKKRQVARTLDQAELSNYHKSNLKPENYDKCHGKSVTSIYL